MKKPITNFQALEVASPFPASAYQVDLSWRYLRDSIDRYIEDYQLDLNPDFQREHVWTEDQQRAYIKYIISGGPSGKDIYLACPGWYGKLSGNVGPMVMVDGKQRLTAALRFMDNLLQVDGKYYYQWEGVLRLQARFHWHVADIERPAMLRWYLALNDGGTPHTAEELEKVRKLLAKEGSK